MSNSSEEQAASSPRPFQFSMRSLLILMVICCIIFAVFKWTGMTVSTALLVTIILLASLLAAFGLILALSHAANQSEDDQSNQQGG